MSGKYRIGAGGTGYGRSLWPVLLALLMVLIPTACVLWFLNETVHNERLAGRQKLLEAYRGHLPLFRDRLDAYWQRQAASLDAMAASRSGSAAWAACVRAGLADSAVCYTASGQLDYPAPAAIPRNESPEDPAWAEAAQREYARDGSRLAAAAYGRIAEQAADPSIAARALQSQARCLARAGRTAEAIRVLAETLDQSKYAQSLDPAGRRIVADAQFRALELWPDRTQPGFAALARRLAQCLADYQTPLPAAQRRFLIHELDRLSPGLHEFPTLPAEELAAAYLESMPGSADGVLRPAGLPDFWHFASPSRRVVGLVRRESIVRRSAELIAADALPAEVRIALAPADAETSGDTARMQPAGLLLPGWRLTLSLDPSDAFADRRVAVYVWIAVLVIVAMSILALLVAGLLRRQMRVTRLKNDLLATVSHELKTPLASIRLLVDTLLDSESLDTTKTREYLGLMAKENARLSRLIDNFLSFSRMERGKQTFELAEVPPAEIVRRAVDAAGERFHAPGCRLDVEAPAELPNVRADSDALVTALLNLLDNAYKYSGDDKQIALRVSADGDHVCFAVADNGIGLPARALKKIFRPFYQADRRLSRGTGGCGLGLSIVKSIVDAHGGTIRVASRPGEGTTFTIALARVRP